MTAVKGEENVIDVAYVLSVNYSGSHLLAQLIGAHSRCASIGELRNYRKFTNPTHRLAATSDFVLNPLFTGLSGTPQDQWYELIHSRIRAEYPEVTTLVDNSKKVEWARQHAEAPGIRSHYIHLIRDPRALLRRWTNNFDTSRARRRQRRELVLHRPSRISTALFGSDEEVLVYKWLLANQEITRFIRESGRMVRAVTYYDLVTRTPEVLGEVMAGLGMAFEPEQLAFGEGKSFGTRKTEYEGMTARSEIRFDCRWKRELTEEAQAACTGNPQVQRYLESLGLRFCDEGLTRYEDARPEGAAPVEGPRAA